MGQRHQLFAAAKVNGKYRTLAVTHHQWLYGFDVIKRCLFLLEVLRANASGLSRELRRAAKLDWDRDVPKDKEITSGYVFPFIANTLFLGTADGGRSLDGGFVYLLSLNTTPEDTINDDGFTIFDITDPANPSYAFFFEKKLIGVMEYLEPYAEEQRLTFGNKRDVLKLECMPKVDLAAVESLWPHTKWSCAWGNEPAPTCYGQSSAENLSSTFKDITLARVVDEALKSAPESSAWMAYAARIPDFRAALRARFRAQPSLLHPRSKVAVLGLAFEETDVVDLSIVEDLKPRELLAIVKRLSVQTKPHSLSLILPDMSDLTSGMLKEVLDNAKIAILDLGNTAVNLKGLLKVIGASTVRTFTSPALYKRAFDLTATDQMAEGFGGTYRPAFPSTLFPNGAQSNFPLSQVIYVRQKRSSSNPRLHSGGLHWERMLQTLGPDVNLTGRQGRGEDPKGPSMLVMPLQDALLSLTTISVAVPKLLARFAQTSDEELSYGSLGISMALSLGMTDDNKTLPIPAEALAAWNTYIASSDATTPLMQTEPALWSLLVFHECTTPEDNSTYGPHQPTEVRYAFCTTSPDGVVKAVDAKGFFSATSLRDNDNVSEDQMAALTSQWQASMAQLEECADPVDDAKHRRLQKGRVVVASLAEVQGGLKVLDVYNEEIRQQTEKGRKWMAEWESNAEAYKRSGLSSA